MIKCLGKDRNGDVCRNNQLGESNFCKFHQYMNDYSDDMLSKLQVCGGCKKMYYFENVTKTCDKCKQRGKKTRKETKSNLVLCDKQECNFKRSKENKYCGKHQLCIFEDETLMLNKRVCFNYIRGCRAQLDISYKYIKCSDCLETDREKDKMRRAGIVEKNNNLTEGESKYCTTCCKELTLDNFVGTLNDITKTCITCRSDNKLQDSRRDKEHRNATVRNNIRPQYSAYIKGAKERNLEFNITFEQYEILVKNHCYYCNAIQERGFNGIDRKASHIGYLIENCVSCCQMCNYMKGPLSVTVFINRIEHILTQQNLINGKLFPHCFANHKKSSFVQYRTRAINFGREFLLSEIDYDNITKNPCYICGKLNDSNNENGIDRLDNKKGYSLDNVNACCAECNYMKIDYSFGNMIQKFIQIYDLHKSTTFENELVRTTRFCY